jgi:ATP phosphoribosyltransferase regulatory subunit
MDEIGVTGEERQALFAALAARDMVGLGGVIGSLRISEDDRQAILDVASMRGGPEVLTAAKELVRGPEMEAALKRLARTYYLVSRYRFAGRILFDFGIMRNFDYYTGIVFEVLGADLGFPLGGGGRYDGLLARYGRPLPAVGFALGLDRVHIAVTERGQVRLPDAAGAVLVGGLDPFLDLAMELREAGLRVLALMEGATEEAARRQAEASGLPYIVMPAARESGGGAGTESGAGACAKPGGEPGRFKLLETGSGDYLEVSREELIERIKG